MIDQLFSEPLVVFAMVIWALVMGFIGGHFAAERDKGGRS